MIARRSAKLISMAVFVRVPSTRGSALKDGAAMTVKSGMCFLCSSRLLMLMIACSSTMAPLTFLRRTAPARPFKSPIKAEVRTTLRFGYCSGLPLHGEAGVTGRTAAADHGIAPGFGCLVSPARLRTMRGHGFVRHQN